LQRQSGDPITKTATELLALTTAPATAGLLSPAATRLDHRDSARSLVLATFSVDLDQLDLAHSSRRPDLAGHPRSAKQQLHGGYAATAREPVRKALDVAFRTRLDQHPAAHEDSESSSLSRSFDEFREVTTLIEGARNLGATQTLAIDPVEHRWLSQVAKARSET
jgi:hypothetical protein